MGGGNDTLTINSLVSEMAASGGQGTDTLNVNAGSYKIWLYLGNLMNSETFQQMVLQCL